MTHTIVFAFVIALLLCLSVGAQTPACGKTDYKCQLDVQMKALQANPKEPENYYNLALVFQRSGAFKEAVEAYTMYLSIPGVSAEYQADGYNNRGISYKGLKKYDLAIADYTKAIELFPRKSDLFLVNRGIAKRDQGMLSEAMADYDAAIKANPKYAVAYARRAALKDQSKRTDDAIADYTKAIELTPEDAESYYNRGTIRLQRKEFAQAIPDFDKYVSMASDPVYLADGYINRGLSHYYMGNQDKALADYKKVIELQPRRPNGYRARAILYREMKKVDLAEADERMAAQLAGQ